MKNILSWFIHHTTLFFIYFICSASVQAIDILHQPFYIKNDTFFKRIFLFPVLELGQSLPKNTLRFSTTLNTSNIAKIDSVDGEQNEYLVLDAELSELNILLHYGFHHDLEFSFSTSLLHISNGGLFDADIANFHNLLGFPRGNRIDFDHFAFKVLYQRKNQTLIDNSNFNFHTNLTHYQIGIKWNIIDDDNDHYLATKLNYKTSANKDKNLFIDNNKNDYALSLFHTKTNCSSIQSLTCLNGFHVVQIGRSELVGSFQKNEYQMYQFGLNFQLWEQFVIKHALYFQTPVYDSKILALGENNLQFLLGVTYKTGIHSFDFAFSEDFTIAASPDIIIQFAYNAFFY